MRSRTRDAIAGLIAITPPLAWVMFAVLWFGPTRGYWPVLGIALVVSVGLFGLMGIFLAWFPWTMERLGLRRFAAWLRTWWDEDAR